MTCPILAGEPRMASQAHSRDSTWNLLDLSSRGLHCTVKNSLEQHRVLEVLDPIFGQHASQAVQAHPVMSEIDTWCRSAADAFCKCRDPVYFQIKSTLWDLFPAWEDKQYDAAFREMLWASQGCESSPYCLTAREPQLLSLKAHFIGYSQNFQS